MQLNPARIDPILKLIGQVWARTPDKTLGQVFAGLAPGFLSSPINYSDDKLQVDLQERLTDLVKERKSA